MADPFTMDLAAVRASATAVIRATPEALYDYIADMPSVGEISPQCTGGVWESDERDVGAYFVGSNAMGERAWQARMRVVVADRPREFAWENIGDGSKPAPDDVVPFARWGYTFEASPDGTLVTESWQLLNMYKELAAAGDRMIGSLPSMIQPSMEETLRRLAERFSR